MADYKDIASFFEERGPEDIERFVGKNLDISQQVYAILKNKGWSQKYLAQELGKSDAEVSKWLSGTHNLTLRSITKMEAVLKQDIILTPMKAKALLGDKIKYVTIEIPARTNRLPFSEHQISRDYIDSSSHQRLTFYENRSFSNEHTSVVNEPESEGYYNSNKESLNLLAAA